MTSSTVPRYQQVKDLIIGRISNGELRPRDRVPSENELVEAMSVSRMTANRALRELTKEGYVDRIAGRGTYVSDFRSQSHVLEVQNIADEIAGRGHTHSSLVVRASRQHARGEVAKAGSEDSTVEVALQEQVRRADRDQRAGVGHLMTSSSGGERYQEGGAASRGELGDGRGTRSRDDELGGRERGRHVVDERHDAGVAESRTGVSVAHPLEIALTGLVDDGEADVGDERQGRGHRLVERCRAL